ACTPPGLALMAHASLTMDPLLAALMREVHARWGQPGRLWPDPETTDSRTDGQRMHDALVHALQLSLSADAAKTGAPAAIVVRMNLDQLATLDGCGQTDGGSRVPVPEAVAMAQNNQWFPAPARPELGTQTRPEQTDRIAVPTSGTVRRLRRMHAPRLRPRRQTQPSPPRRQALGSRRTDQHRRTRASQRRLPCHDPTNRMAHHSGSPRP